MSLDLIKIVIVGHVDHGKSTLIGRLLYETGNVQESKIQDLKNFAEKHGQEIEFANLLDAFQEEQQQNVTIDTTTIFFKTPEQNYEIIDAPGHKEFLKNMVTGASSADAAILIVDAAEGIREQTKRHAYILSLLGIKNVIVAINKMDLVEFNQDRFKQVKEDTYHLLDRLGVKPYAFVPLSAKKGINLSLNNIDSACSWYQGRTVLGTLHQLSEICMKKVVPLRFPVQDVYKVNGKRIIVGRVESGELQKGDHLLFSPSFRTTRVKSIEKWNNLLEKAGEGECVGITMDDQIFIERGETAGLKGHAPERTNCFEGNVFWLGTKPLEVGKNYLLKLATQETICQVKHIKKRLDTSTLEIVGQNPHEIENMEVGEVVISTQDQIALDLFSKIPSTGRFVIVDDYDVCGGGIIINKLQN
jgi:sulfate adenylyltransferase large subunit